MQRVTSQRLKRKGLGADFVFYGLGSHIIGRRF